MSYTFSAINDLPYSMFRFITHFKLLFFVLLVSGCAAIGIMEYDKIYGKANVENRINQTNISPAQIQNFHTNIKPILESRCVVCHACYDAPCQLKMENVSGIERGANKELVYNGERLLTGKIPTGLTELNSINSDILQKTRAQGFFPVLNERQQSATANTQASVFYRMLALKQQHPLPDDALLNNSFDLSLDRDQQCPTIEEFEQYQRDFPLAGMPYGLPALSTQEHNTLVNWLAQGAKLPEPSSPTQAEEKMIMRWEQLLNGQSNKEKLIARYLFEHLFLANLYFQENSDSYFKLVRSTTPPGEAVALIQSRRPFDPPTKKAPFYYRLIKNNNVVVAKRHMPYPFGLAKLNYLTELFYQPDYQVEALPDYALETSANPFITFKAIPAKARYRFLLEQAQFSIMNFIKGPVCRGQIALNVIEDHFWVAFLDPDYLDQYHSNDFIADNSELLQLPASTSDKTLSLLYWRQYAKSQQEYLTNKLHYIKSLNLKPQELGLNLLWAGNGNPNATLTVYRHFDSASVLQGFVGQPPKTAWVISYSLLERIHYLLVAGFDVYGNVSHQLKTRLYMDFLRMEAEGNFITLLPKAQRRKVHEYWYRDTNPEIKDYIFSDNFDHLPETGVQYKTDTPLLELYDLIAEHTNHSALNDYNIEDKSRNRASKTKHQGKIPSHKGIEQKLAQLQHLVGAPATLLPQVSYVAITSPEGDYFYSLISNSAHSNVAHLFAEAERRLPKEDNLSILRGIVGTYPNAFFQITTEQLTAFVQAVSELKTEQDYQHLKDNFSVRRTDKNFWAFADKLHAWYKKYQRDSAGLLDFNRLENR
ncbi:fatty acid cis/trans isomerase [Colwellia asteriadis]|uniref:Fatty acid cis/trans isomerase n=1 Tax=Colwellia asteriadis TaxID=517723 RepID=A0ABN1L412_9GAMM